MGITGQEPAGVGLFAVYRDSITGEFCRFPACARSHRQRVPAPRISHFADDNDFLQLAAAMDPSLFMRAEKLAENPSRPSGAWPGLRNTTSSVINVSKRARSLALTALIQAE